MKWQTTIPKFGITRGLRLLAGLFISVAVSLAPFLPSHAVSIMALPATANTINSVYAEQHVLVPNDQMYIVDFFTGYTSGLPAYSATQSYTVKVLTSGGALVGSAVPYAFFQNGYQRNIVMIYVPPASAPTWNSGETVTLAGNPGLTWAGTIPTTNSPVTYWSPSTSVSFTQTLLAGQTITLAGYLQQAWSPTFTMLQSTSAGQKLSTDGQTFFLAVMPTLQQMAPAAFATSTLIPTTNLKQIYGDQYALSGTATLTNSPVKINAGTNSLTTTNGGTVTLVLSTGQTAVAAGGTVSGSPAHFVNRSNSIVVTGAGTFTVTTTGASYQSELLLQPIGTALDTTGMAAMMNIPVIWADAILVFGFCLLVDFLIIYTTNKLRQPGYEYGYAGVGGSGVAKWVLLVDWAILIFAAILGMFNLIVDIGLAVLSAFILVTLLWWNKSSS